MVPFTVKSPPHNKRTKLAILFSILPFIVIALYSMVDYKQFNKDYKTDPVNFYIIFTLFTVYTISFVKKSISFILVSTVI